MIEGGIAVKKASKSGSKRAGSGRAVATGRGSSFRGGASKVPATPTRRRLRVYAFDPSLSTRLDMWRANQVTLNLPWEPLGVWNGREAVKGPVGDYLEVVDVDPASGLSYEPVDLDEARLLASDGVEASEIDPKFHQQMVYAVGMNTIVHFERALGRSAMWNPRWVFRGGKWSQEYVHRLRMYPHAMREANAYYSPDKKAILFGYFKAVDDGSGLIMPGSTVFTCLSHDIIAHEVTHALLDGLHPYFTDASNADVLAFHEAFADIVAIFSRFSMPEVVRTELARAQGRFDAENMLGKLAQQFGAALGKRKGLREYIGKEADPSLIKRTMEPHDRGAILVAAVFDAFMGIYRHRTRDLMRIATGGTGVMPDGDLHPDLVERLSREAFTSARHVLTICVRALDYCPPVDITFGEYLRSLITADTDMVPDDDKSYRVAIIEGFRRHGIYPEGVNSMSEEALRWERPQFSEGLQECIAAALEEVERREKKDGRREEVVPHGVFLRGTTPPPHLTQRGRAHVKMDRACTIIRDYLLKHLKDEPDIQWQLGVCAGKRTPGSVHALDSRGRPSFQVNRLRQARRVGPAGIEVADYVLEITQKRDGFIDPERQKEVDKPSRSAGGRSGGADFVMRGGCTLNIDMKSHQVRYCMAKNILSDRRLERQREFLGCGVPGMGIYSGKADRETFAMLHRH
ncbi:MAG: hypothetical protein IT435_06105 [Phycisphaerales bacterium]|nr:hypothetical protein [Phycisphaerales bacterium]